MLLEHITDIHLTSTSSGIRSDWDGWCKTIWWRN